MGRIKSKILSKMIPTSLNPDKDVASILTVCTGNPAGKCKSKDRRVANSLTHVYAAKKILANVYSAIATSGSWLVTNQTAPDLFGSKQPDQNPNSSSYP